MKRFSIFEKIKDKEQSFVILILLNLHKKEKKKLFFCWWKNMKNIRWKFIWWKMWKINSIPTITDWNLRRRIGSRSRRFLWIPYQFLGIVLQLLTEKLSLDLSLFRLNFCDFSFSDFYWVFLKFCDEVFF